MSLLTILSEAISPPSYSVFEAAHQQDLIPHRVMCTHTHTHTYTHIHTVTHTHGILLRTQMHTGAATSTDWSECGVPLCLTSSFKQQQEALLCCQCERY